MPTSLTLFDHHRPSRQPMSRSHSRQVERAKSQLSAQASTEAARIEQAAELQALQTDAIACVARRGLQNVALLSRMEGCLATMVPMASGRLATIGDIASLAIAEVVADTARQIG